MIVIGIDPGLDGAVAFYDQDHNKLSVYDTPTMGEDKKRVINATELGGIIVREGAGLLGVAYLEDVHAMKGWGIGSAFRFGESKGVIQGVLGALNVPLRRVSPQKWKKALGLSRDKGASRKLAIEMFPHYAEVFARVKDDNRAEAVLIAKYGWSELK